MTDKLEISGQVGQVVVGTLVQVQPATPEPARDCRTCAARVAVMRVARHQWLMLLRRQRWLRGAAY